MTPNDIRDKNLQIYEFYATQLKHDVLINVKLPQNERLYTLFRPSKVTEKTDFTKKWATRG